jgi:hypothetical protein
LAAREDKLADRPGELCAEFVVCLAWPQACQVALTADVAAEKKAAIGAFANQPTGREGAADPVLPPGIVAHFTRPLEVLLR